MLILWDIDATLLSTSGVGQRAMEEAGQALHGPGFSARGIDFAGRLDPLLMTELLIANHVSPDAASIGAFRACYAGILARRLTPGMAIALPGVAGLLAALAHDRRITQGLLTGNFEETGLMKLQGAGLDPELFRVRVWGDHSPHDPPAREHLPGVAIERVSALWGRPARGEEVLVIGDTPHDIACARAHGCRALGVATGKYARGQLAHADLAVDNLGDVEGVLRWILEH